MQQGRVHPAPADDVDGARRPHSAHHCAVELGNAGGKWIDRSDHGLPETALRRHGQTYADPAGAARSSDTESLPSSVPPTAARRSYSSRLEWYRTSSSSRWLVVMPSAISPDTNRPTARTNDRTAASRAGRWR